MTKEWTWQAERAALVKRVKELEGLNAKQHEALLCARAMIDTPIARRKLNLDPHDERITIIRAALEGEKT